MAYVDCPYTTGLAAGGGWYAFGGAFATALAGVGGAHIRHACNTFGWTAGRGYYNFGSLPVYVSITSVTAYSYGWSNCGGAFRFRIYNVGSYSQSGNYYHGGAGWIGYAVPRVGGGTFSRAEVAAMSCLIYSGANGNGNPLKLDYWMLRVVYEYFVQSAHDITSFTNIDSEGAQMNMYYNAGGDGDTEYYLEYGNAPSTYQHNFGWSQVGLSGTGVQTPNYHIQGEGAGAMVYARFRTRNCADTGVVYCPEHSFRTLGGGSATSGIILP